MWVQGVVFVVGVQRMKFIVINVFSIVFGYSRYVIYRGLLIYMFLIYSQFFLICGNFYCNLVEILIYCLVYSRCFINVVVVNLYMNWYSVGYLVGIQ